LRKLSLLIPPNYFSGSAALVMNKAKISLQASEGLVFQAAARIYAAFVAADRVRDGEEQQWIERAIRDAIQLAQSTEKLVQSDSEMD
jgi:hypothetical protein